MNCLGMLWIHCCDSLECFLSQDCEILKFHYLRTVKFSNIAGLTMAVQILVDNFKRYPQDRTTVFRSFKGMGTVHARFTEFLVESLLKTDPKFLTQEQSIGDPVYACHLILIFNASLSNSAIISLLPKHCFQHYLYFRNMYPDAFQSEYPNISVGPISSSQAVARNEKRLITPISPQKKKNSLTSRESESWSRT